MNKFNSILLSIGAVLFSILMLTRATGFFDGVFVILGLGMVAEFGNLVGKYLRSKTG